VFFIKNIMKTALLTNPIKSRVLWLY